MISRALPIEVEPYEDWKQKIIIFNQTSIIIPTKKVI